MDTDLFGNPISGEISLEDLNSQTCIYCKINKPFELFPKHKAYKTGLDSRCKECVRKQSNLRSQLHKIAPDKPEVCQCCSRKSDKTLRLDHDHDTNKFRGWICDDCNIGIGKLGDDITGLLKALKYLENHYGTQ